MVYIDMTLIANLLHNWSFDEESGNLIDRWGSNDGVPTDVVQGAVGKLNKAYSWTQNGRVTLSQEISFLLTDNITIDFWYKPVSVAAAYMIFDRTVNTPQLVQAYQNLKDFSFRIRGSNSVGLTTVTYVNAIPVAGVWYHIICERNVGTDQLNVWVNGVPWTTPVTDATTAALGPITLKFGASQPETTQMLRGELDEVRFWKGILAAPEKAKLYNNGLGISVTSPINYGGSGLSASMIPTGLSVTWINDYAQVAFTDSSGGTAKHEIWESKSGGAYTLITELGEGVVSYNYQTWQNANLNFKVRAKISNAVSGFTAPVAITTPLVFKMNQSVLTPVAISDIHLYATGKTVVIDWGDTTTTNISAVTTNPIAKNYLATGNYFIKLSGDINWINFLQWYGAEAQLAGTDITKWVLPEYLQAVHLNDNGIVGNMTNVRFNDMLTYFDINSNDIEWDISNVYLPSLLFEFVAVPNDPSKLTGDISNWELPDRIVHLNIQGNAYGNLSGLVPFVNPSYGSVNIYLKSYHSVGFYGDLSSWITPDLPSIYNCATGCHFTKMPRGHFKQTTLFSFANNLCDSTEIDNLLQYVDNYFVGGIVPSTSCTYTLNGTGMGIPSGVGLAAKASIEGKYIAAGFTATITVNS